MVAVDVVRYRARYVLRSTRFQLDKLVLFETCSYNKVCTPGESACVDVAGSLGALWSVFAIDALPMIHARITRLIDRFC